MNDQFDKEANYVAMLNIFQIYYKTLFRRPKNEHMFTDITEENCTNRCLELLYEHMHKYKKYFDTNKSIIYKKNEFPKNVDDCDELFLLKVNNKEIVCELLIPLVQYLMEFKWEKINWSINQLKIHV